jgi:hypothetical protein
MNVPQSTERVRSRTSAQVNRDILIQTEGRIRYYADHPDDIDARLNELDEEWDIERLLETNASLLALSGIVLGVTVGKRFLLLSAAVLAFLCQHAVEGWCPPMPVLRRLGVRTQTEIEYERYALKLLRGDFTKTAREGRQAVDAVIESVRPTSLDRHA